MTDQARFKSKLISGDRGLSRRDILRASAAFVPAGLIIPGWFTANAQTSGTFDYYISTSGSDSNPGTLASPWAITSLRTVSPNFRLINGTGKRIGLLPGTYDISRLMVSNSPDVGALQIPGGASASAVTYLASCDASGNYSPRTATIDMKGASGLFGGGHSTGPSSWDGPGLAHCGQYPTAYTTSNLTIDGLRFTGFSYRGLDIGAAYNADGPSGLTNILITNCEFTGGGFNSGDAEDNCAALWIQGGSGVTVSNNWFHDNLGHAGSTSSDHLNAIIVWGPNQGPAATTYNTVIEFNTVVNSGSIFGKEIKIEGTICRYNYIDSSMYTSNGSIGFQDWTGANASGLSRPSYFYNNIVKLYGGTAGGCVAFGWPTLSNSYGWTTPLEIYNNTIICVGGSGPVVGWLTGSGGATKAVKWYNNIYVNNGSGGSWNGFGNYYVNPAVIGVWDYNLSPASGCSWTLYSNGNFTSALGNYSNRTAFASGVSAQGGASGVETHSLAATPTFVGSGSYATQYQLASGSPGKGAGSTNGTSGGTPTDMGAWGNGATQIGCNFAGSTGAAVPSAPALSTVS